MGDSSVTYYLKGIIFLFLMFNPQIILKINTNMFYYGFIFIGFATEIVNLYWILLYFLERPHLFKFWIKYYIFKGTLFLDLTKGIIFLFLMINPQIFIKMNINMFYYIFIVIGFREIPTYFYSYEVY